MATPLPQAPRGQKDTLASPEAMRLLTFGYGELGADYYWLKAISHFGDKRMHALHYPNLHQLLDRVIALDPKFASAYVFAGQTLSYTGEKPDAVIAILHQGMQERPDSWRIPFVLGFDEFYLKGDYLHAASSLTLAARLPGCPDYVGPFATRLAAEAGEPEVGLQFIDSMLHAETDPAIIASYRKRKALLELELDLKILNEAATAYTKERAHPPEKLDDLVHAKLVNMIPQDPLGGAFFLGGDKRVHTTHEQERMRLPSSLKHLHPETGKAEASDTP